MKKQVVYDSFVKDGEHDTASDKAAKFVLKKSIRCQMQIIEVYESRITLFKKLSISMK